MKLKDHGIDVIDHMYDLARPIRNGYEKMCRIDGQEFCDFTEKYIIQLYELRDAYDEYIKLFGRNAPIHPDMLLGEQCIEDLMDMTVGGWDGHHGTYHYPNFDVNPYI